ncbi:hypothetical protein KR054_008069, partial [Drosophila jambulina]
MDTLRQKISELFTTPTTKSESTPESKTESKPESKSEEITLGPITSGDLPVPELKRKQFTEEPSVDNYSYELEFVDFLDRNAPKGLSKKIMDMLPYLQLSLLSWPAYWVYRGYNWQHRRNTERISVYIQRTYQQAKLMQVAILATGAFAVTMSR